MDYQEIMEGLTEDDVKQILTILGIDYTDKGSYLQMRTYCHHHKDEEASEKLYYYKDNKIFMCYSECHTMSIFKFLSNYYEAQGVEFDWYNDVYNLVLSHSVVEHTDTFGYKKYKPLSNLYSCAQPKPLKVYNEGALGCFIKYYPPEWLNNGISKEAMDKYGILYSIAQNKIIIPHRNEMGQLVGIRGRALNPDEIENYGKYAPVWIEGQCYSHPLSLNIYGLYQNKENIKQTGVCFLGESEKFCMQLESFHHPNCGIAICGSNVNKYIIRQLMKECHPQEIILCLDNEEKEHSTVYYNHLRQIAEKYRQYCNISFIYDFKHLTKHKDSPSDCGEDIFNQLIERRVKLR